MHWSLKPKKEVQYLYGVQKGIEMKREGWFLTAFVGLMAALFLLVVGLGMYDNQQKLNEIRVEQEQSEIAHEKCLLAGYPEFLVVNHKFYCTGKDGEALVKEMRVE